MSTSRNNLRRRLKLDSIEDLFAETDRLVAAERSGTLVRAGNWSLGQTLGHLSTWADFAFDGDPDVIHPPAPVRWVARLMRNRLLRNGFPAGVRLGKLPGGTVGLDLLDTDEGLRRLRAAFGRLRATSPTIANPVFGKLTHAQWIQLNLRHAELHLSFLKPGE